MGKVDYYHPDYGNIKLLLATHWISNNYSFPFYPRTESAIEGTCSSA